MDCDRNVASFGIFLSQKRFYCMSKAVICGDIIQIVLIPQDRSVQVGNPADSFASVFSYDIVYVPPREQFKCGRGAMLLVLPRMKLKLYGPDLMNSNLNFVCLCIRVEDNFCLPQTLVQSIHLIFFIEP